MNTLYIIGNGFDLHHGLPTSFQGFREYSKFSNFHRLYENGVFMMLADQSLAEHWNKLEQNLANFDVNDLIEQAKEYYDEDPHENQFLYEVKTAIDSITTGLVTELHNYLSKAEAQPATPNTFLALDTSARFINFNYTNTLERIYNIPSHNICYIHGKLHSSSSIVIGHGMVDPAYEPKPSIDFSKLSEDEFQAYVDEYSQDYEDAVSEAYEYFKISYKDTEACLEAASGFLQELAVIDNVIILGHSMAEIDQIYFYYINQIVRPTCRWWASYYLSSEKTTMLECLEEIVGDYNRINVFELCQLLVSNELKDDEN